MSDFQQDIEEIDAGIPDFTIHDMVKAGVQFGHRCGARNTRFQHFIYGESNGTHIIDLRKSHFALRKALGVLYDYSRKGKRILFVGTVAKFHDSVKELAANAGQYYVCKWKGGTLTNWRTIVSSIKTLKKYNSILESIKDQGEDEEDSVPAYTKKEIIDITKKRDKLVSSFGGIVDMGGMPDLIVMLSSYHEKLAIDEACCIGTPVIGIVDTNADPTRIDYPIPGNDDSLRVFNFYAGLLLEAILNGTREWLSKSGLRTDAVVIDDSTSTIRADLPSGGSSDVADSKSQKKDSPSSKSPSSARAVKGKITVDASNIKKVDDTKSQSKSPVASADLQKERATPKRKVKRVSAKNIAVTEVGDKSSKKQGASSAKSSQKKNPSSDVSATEKGSTDSK